MYFGSIQLIFSGILQSYSTYDRCHPSRDDRLALANLDRRAALISATGASADHERQRSGAHERHFPRLEEEADLDDDVVPPGDAVVEVGGHQGGVQAAEKADHA